MGELTAKVLVDNIARNALKGEWGLAIYMEYRDRKILLDTGASGLFAQNAKHLGVDLAQVEYGVLSHAHYDHSDGIRTFFEQNDKASFFLREGAEENCYHRHFVFHKYIGIQKGMLGACADRIRHVSGDYVLCSGAVLVPHKTAGLDQIGKKVHMYRREGRRWQPEDFCHEQSLVLETEKGLVIFNSCSHGGADNIIREVAATFPDKPIYAILGGFHLYASSEEDILNLAKRIRDTGIQRVVTGHCTGDRAFALLKKELGDSLEQIYTGYTFEV